jgi:ATP synthase protein I
MNPDERLKNSIRRRADRMRKAERERPTLLAQTAFLGTLGLVFVLPMVGGAFLGRWLDEQMAGYSLRWTLSLLFLGLIVGAYSVYHLIKSRD